MQLLKLNITGKHNTHAMLLSIVGVTVQGRDPELAPGVQEVAHDGTSLKQMPAVTPVLLGSLIIMLVGCRIGPKYVCPSVTAPIATSYLEVLTTDSSFFSAQLTLVNSREGEAQSLVQLYEAFGAGWK